MCIRDRNRTDYIIVSGEFNASVGNNTASGAVELLGEQHRNSTGDSLIRFTTSNDLKITNTFFRKKILISDRGSRSIIDYVLANNKISQQI